MASLQDWFWWYLGPNHLTHDSYQWITGKIQNCHLTWTVLKMYTKELRLMSSHSLAKEAFSSSEVETELRENTRAALWLRSFSNGTDSSFSSCRPTWNCLNRCANSETGMYLYGLPLFAQYCSWSFFDVTCDSYWGKMCFSWLLVR